MHADNAKKIYQAQKTTSRKWNANTGLLSDLAQRRMGGLTKEGGRGEGVSAGRWKGLVDSSVTLEGWGLAFIFKVESWIFFFSFLFLSFFILFYIFFFIKCAEEICLGAWKTVLLLVTMKPLWAPRVLRFVRVRPQFPSKCLVCTKWVQTFPTFIRGINVARNK